MKITGRQLKRIIKEERKSLLHEMRPHPLTSHHGILNSDYIIDLMYDDLYNLSGDLDGKDGSLMDEETWAAFEGAIQFAMKQLKREFT